MIKLVGSNIFYNGMHYAPCVPEYENLDNEAKAFYSYGGVYNPPYCRFFYQIIKEDGELNPSGKVLAYKKPFDSSSNYYPTETFTCEQDLELYIGFLAWKDKKNR